MKIIRLFFLVLALISSQNIFGLDKFWEGIRVIEINYDKNEIFVLKQDFSESSELLDPKDKLDQYFLIRSGVKIPTSTNIRGNATFFGPIPDKVKTCTGENLYDSSFTVGSNYLAALEKKKILNACVRFKVEETKKGKLEFEPIQENCKLEKINDFTVNISTGDCFFKAIPGQLLNVKIIPDRNCADSSFLSVNKLSPSSVVADWNAYLYPDKKLGAIFNPTDEALWSKKLFINLNPSEALLKITQSNIKEQIIYRPSTFVFPDFMLSDISIGNLKNSPGSYADLSFLISNFGSIEFCQSEICSNYGNFDFPFAPILTLYEIDPRNGKKLELNSFIMGDRIPGKWNGTFTTRVNFQSFLFEAGKKYAIELTFSNPMDSFLELKDSVKSTFGLNGTSLGRLGGANTSFNSFGGLPTFGNLGTIGGLNTEDGVLERISNLPEGQIPMLIESFNDPTFPPEYKMVCNKNLSFCQKTNVKDQEKLSVSFEVKGIGQNNKLQLDEKIIVERSGKFLSEYKIVVDFKKKPTLNCGGIL